MTQQHTVSVVGSGEMGTGIVRALVAAEREVLWSGRDPGRVAARIDELGVRGVNPGGHDEALRADVVVLAIWHSDALVFADRFAAALAGRVVVDIANPFTDDFQDYVYPETTSAAEELARRLPRSRVVGAFKNTYAAVFDAPGFAGVDSDVLVTGDDEDARRTVIDLFRGAPFRFLDAGALRNSRTVERMTLLEREIGRNYGLMPLVGWRFLGHPD